MDIQVAVIGGTGFESALTERFGAPDETRRVETDFGSADINLFSTEFGQTAFLPRHGIGHTVAPHEINHKANIRALAQLGARLILSTSAVGSLKLTIEPGDIVVPDDFIDLRGGAPTTLFDHGKVVHTDFTTPFDCRGRDCLLRCAEDLTADFGLPASIIHPAGVYVCVSGPRYETPAEVRCYASWGGDIVGMTVAAEAILAREQGLRYASISIATNFGTGLAPAPLSHRDVEQMMAERRPLVSSIVAGAAGLFAGGTEVK